jgi:hypothetical protein
VCVEEADDLIEFETDFVLERERGVDEEVDEAVAVGVIISMTLQSERRMRTVR